MRIAITGTTSGLGAELKNILEKDNEVIPINRDSFLNLDLLDLSSIDILINNAGMITEELIGKNSSSFVSQAVMKQTFHTNLFAVVALTQKLLPLLMKSVAGRIVNLSSIVGSLTLQSMENSPIDPAKAFAYNASKTALNAYTIHLAHELKNTKIKVNSAHPGWVKTELGGPYAPMEIADSYKTSLRLATLDSHGPTGGFFHEADVLPW